MSKNVLLLMVFLGLAACGSDPIPKPVGYFRIDLPPDTFKSFGDNCPYTFKVHEFTVHRPKRENCWFDIHYPRFNAMVQLTYRPVDNNIDTLLNDMHNLVFRHTVKADGIKEKLFINEEDKVYGTLYQLVGDAATHTQFFLTDSNNHFLRGVVYFNAVPNEDSLRPVNEYMYQQMIHLIETTRWE
ncbi:MAG: gliding motility lipoprotein GldD [Cryomorphaceae bacterium]|nr:gliding motility lipoprotein GldD [Cryomorphaceae bacterium]